MKMTENQLKFIWCILFVLQYNIDTCFVPVINISFIGQRCKNPSVITKYYKEKYWIYMVEFLMDVDV